jgi:putative membrane protein
MNFTTASTSGTKTGGPTLLHKIYLAIFLLVWIWTLIATPDTKNWLIENTLTLFFISSIVLTFKKHRLSDLSYTFIFVYILLHIYGATYTYSENPFGYWLKELFHTSRNHYDRIVHFSFGFMLAYPMRDLYLNVFGFPSKYSWLLPTEITMSFSGLYEIIEWLVADVIYPSQGTAYLGTQGDVWDAQKDMFLAFSGSVIILVLAAVCKKVFVKNKVVLKA